MGTREFEQRVHRAHARDADLCHDASSKSNRDAGPDVAQIATFAKVGRTGLGVGSALFRATAEACRAAGYAWINAEIRADNASGLTYYQSRGFEDYGRIADYRMANGQRVDKVLKRYDL